MSFCKTFKESNTKNVKYKKINEVHLTGYKVIDESSLETDNKSRKSRDSSGNKLRSRKTKNANKVRKPSVTFAISVDEMNRPERLPTKHLKTDEPREACISSSLPKHPRLTRTLTGHLPKPTAKTMLQLSESPNEKIFSSNIYPFPGKVSFKLPEVNGTGSSMKFTVVPFAKPRRSPNCQNLSLECNKPYVAKEIDPQQVETMMSELTSYVVRFQKQKELGRKDDEFKSLKKIERKTEDKQKKVEPGDKSSELQELFNRKSNRQKKRISSKAIHRREKSGIYEEDNNEGRYTEPTVSERQLLNNITDTEKRIINPKAKIKFSKSNSSNLPIVRSHTYMAQTRRLVEPCNLITEANPVRLRPNREQTVQRETPVIFQEIISKVKSTESLQIELESTGIVDKEDLRLFIVGFHKDHIQACKELGKMPNNLFQDLRAESLDNHENTTETFSSNDVPTNKFACTTQFDGMLHNVPEKLTRSYFMKENGTHLTEKRFINPSDGPTLGEKVTTFASRNDTVRKSVINYNLYNHFSNVTNNPIDIPVKQNDNVIFKSHTDYETANSGQESRQEIFKSKIVTVPPRNDSVSKCMMHNNLYNQCLNVTNHTSDIPLKENMSMNNLLIRSNTDFETITSAQDITSKLCGICSSDDYTGTYVSNDCGKQNYDKILKITNDSNKIPENEELNLFKNLPYSLPVDYETTCITKNSIPDYNGEHCIIAKESISQNPSDDHRKYFTSCIPTDDLTNRTGLERNENSGYNMPLSNKGKSQIKDFQVPEPFRDEVPIKYGIVIPYTGPKDCASKNRISKWNTNDITLNCSNKTQSKMNVSGESFSTSNNNCETKVKEQVYKFDEVPFKIPQDFTRDVMKEKVEQFNNDIMTVPGDFVSKAQVKENVAQLINDVFASLPNDYGCKVMLEKCMDGVKSQFATDPDEFTSNTGSRKDSTDLRDTTHSDNRIVKIPMKNVRVQMNKNNGEEIDDDTITQMNNKSTSRQIDSPSETFIKDTSPTVNHNIIINLANNKSIHEQTCLRMGTQSIRDVILNVNERNIIETHSTKDDNTTVELSQGCENIDDMNRYIEVYRMEPVLYTVIHVDSEQDEGVIENMHRDVDDVEVYKHEGEEKLYIDEDDGKTTLSNPPSVINCRIDFKKRGNSEIVCNDINNGMYYSDTNSSVESVASDKSLSIGVNRSDEHISIDRSLFEEEVNVVANVSGECVSIGSNGQKNDSCIGTQPSDNNLSMSADQSDIDIVRYTDSSNNDFNMDACKSGNNLLINTKHSDDSASIESRESENYLSLIAEESNECFSSSTPRSVEEVVGKHRNRNKCSVVNKSMEHPSVSGENVSIASDTKLRFDADDRCEIIRCNYEEVTELINHENHLVSNEIIEHSSMVTNRSENNLSVVSTEIVESRENCELISCEDTQNIKMEMNCQSNNHNRSICMEQDCVDLCVIEKQEVEKNYLNSVDTKLETTETVNTNTQEQHGSLTIDGNKDQNLMVKNSKSNNLEPLTYPAKEELDLKSLETILGLDARQKAKLLNMILNNSYTNLNITGNYECLGLDLEQLDKSFDGSEQANQVVHKSSENKENQFTDASEGAKETEESLLEIKIKNPIVTNSNTGDRNVVCSRKDQGNITIASNVLHYVPEVNIKTRQTSSRNVNNSCKNKSVGSEINETLAMSPKQDWVRKVSKEGTHNPSYVLDHSQDVEVERVNTQDSKVKSKRGMHNLCNIFNPRQGSKQESRFDEGERKHNSIHLSRNVSMGSEDTATINNFRKISVDDEKKITFTKSSEGSMTINDEQKSRSTKSRLDNLSSITKYRRGTSCMAYVDESERDLSCRTSRNQSAYATGELNWDTLKTGPKMSLKTLKSESHFSESSLQSDCNISISSQQCSNDDTVAPDIQNKSNSYFIGRQIVGGLCERLSSKSRGSLPSVENKTSGKGLIINEVERSSEILSSDSYDYIVSNPDLNRGPAKKKSEVRKGRFSLENYYPDLFKLKSSVKFYLKRNPRGDIMKRDRGRKSVNLKESSVNSEVESVELASTSVYGVNSLHLLSRSDTPLKKKRKHWMFFSCLGFSKSADDPSKNKPEFYNNYSEAFSVASKDTSQQFYSGPSLEGKDQKKLLKMYGIHKIDEPESPEEISSKDHRPDTEEREIVSQNFGGSLKPYDKEEYDSKNNGTDDEEIAVNHISPTFEVHLSPEDENDKHSTVMDNYVKVINPSTAREPIQSKMSSELKSEIKLIERHEKVRKLNHDERSIPSDEVYDSRLQGSLSSSRQSRDTLHRSTDRIGLLTRERARRSSVEKHVVRMSKSLLKTTSQNDGSKSEVETERKNHLERQLTPRMRSLSNASSKKSTSKSGSSSRDRSATSYEKHLMRMSRSLLKNETSMSEFDSVRKRICLRKPSVNRRLNNKYSSKSSSENKESESNIYERVKEDNCDIAVSTVNSAVLNFSSNDRRVSVSERKNAERKRNANRENNFQTHSEDVGELVCLRTESQDYAGFYLY